MILDILGSLIVAVVLLLALVCVGAGLLLILYWIWMILKGIFEESRDRW